ncbi:phage shock protein C, PspC [Desulfonatronospira thiodismutans ASO3-1]|uniref:Phage shock protein C, PspC n=1 Tax=Desulfonatronospira thiodismutans ASO3-1 TaxID=555779 RepID=D6STV3_9BACT|nr:PspC domain-containing protein [Desulfonatronospira thiodismutans]EFI34119.1 phage shock protein C, PspC [Desulfonatronospira thiodismutans ASO3-1]
MAEQIHSKNGLYRYQTKKVLGGVLAGLADKWDLNLTGVRLVVLGILLVVSFWKSFVALFMGSIELAVFYAFITPGLALFISVLVYIILWIILPVRGEEKPLNSQNDNSPESLAAKRIKDAYAQGDYALALHHAQLFIREHPDNHKVQDFQSIAEELLKKIKNYP